jgi:hypothetical protein
MGLLIKLKNGDTSLKSLKFGHDRPGGGDSNQPYIKNPIDRPDTPTLNSDFLLRGGISAPLNAAEDVARLTKYFFDFRSPNGLLFTAKQNLLSRTAVKTESSFGPAYGGFSKSIDLKTGGISFDQGNGFLNEGFYTPLSTLAQAGVVAFGGHLNKQGLDPTGLLPELAIKKYQDVVYDLNRKERNLEDPKVPLSLVKKSQRASDAAGRKVAKRNQQELKTKSELAVNVSLPDTGFSEFGSNKNSFAQSKINGFLKKWDAYKDKKAQKKLSKAETAEDKAIEKSTSLFNQVEAIENSAKVYNNRLLKLWDGSGLNSSNPFSAISSVLYSYGGGPNSILGAGKTNIRFATTNDGVTPLRTNSFPVDLQIQPVSYLTTKIFGNEYSPLPGVSLLYQSSFVGSKYLTNPEALFYVGNSDSNYLEDYDRTSNIQPWIQNFVSPNSNEDPKSYLVGTQREPERDIFTSFISVTTASIAYENLTRKNVVNNLEKEGRKSWEYIGDRSVYDPGTLDPRSGLDEYLTRKDTEINPVTRNEDEFTYFSPINNKLTEYGREFIEDSIYDQDTGTANAVDPDSGKLLGKFDESLMDKMLRKTTKDKANYSKPKNNQEGYIANLDKNAGYYTDPKTKDIVFKLDQYNSIPGGSPGVGPDFRITDRNTRGFSEYNEEKNVDGTRYVYGAYDAITTKGTNYSKNVLDKVYYKNGTSTRTSTALNSPTDIIPFKITIVDPRNPSKGQTNLTFRAYIDSFSDSFKNSWSDQTYMGRAEKQYKYSSFDRNISFGFTVVADSSANLSIMYNQLNTLASSVAPTYTGQGYMTGNLHRLTLGDYVSNQWGILNGGFTYEISQETPWQISKGNQLPLYIKVTGINFTVIHNFIPAANIGGVSNKYINQ